MSAGLAERLSPGFPLERALANLLAQYAQIQVEMLRKGLSQPGPTSTALAE